MFKLDDTYILLSTWRDNNKLSVDRVKQYLKEKMIETKKVGKYLYIKKDYPLPFSDDISCLVCGGKFQQLTICHIRKHGLTKEEYKEKYGADTLISKTRLDRALLHRKGAVLSQETKDKISKKHTGKKLSEETKEKISNKMSGIEKSEETKEKMSHGQRASHQSETRKKKEKKRENFNKMKIELKTFLDQYNISFEKYEMFEYYIPIHNLIIEFNSVTPDVNIARTFASNKYKDCELNNKRLIMINMDEWIERQESIKRKILNLCGLSEKGVGARKLQIRKIDNKIAHPFVEKYHIQGKTGTVAASYGAFDKDEFGLYSELVAVIQFNHQRNTHDIELIRFCTNGKLYAGVFSRLFKHAVDQEQYTEVLSFADLRYSDGNVYEKNGFIKDKVIDPDYKYVKDGKTYHKSNFTKTLINKKFGIDMTNLTEREAMSQLKYKRIYDCGKIKYIWKNS